MLISFFSLLPASAQQLVTWTTQSVVIESDFSSWSRMVQLPDGSWLVAYMVTTTPNRIRIKKSTDKMRTWQFMTEIVEAGRDLDNPTLCLRQDGLVMLAMRSVIVGQSYEIETYTSADAGNSFQYQSQVDWDEHLGGVYEPFLYILPDGSIACLYTNEKHRFETPAYSQIISERVSTDGGVTWGSEIWAVSQPGAARPGEPNIVPVQNGTILSLYYEICDTDNCAGHVSYSTDGRNWTGIGPGVPFSFQDLQVVAMTNGLLFGTSNNHEVIMSNDGSSSWTDTGTHPFTFGVWPCIYQTGLNEIAISMTGAGDQGQTGEYVRFGTVAADIPVLPSSLQEFSVNPPPPKQDPNLNSPSLGP